MNRRVLVAVLLCCLRSVPSFGQGFYAIAHMTNSAAAVDWALGEGVNGLEMDLQFDKTGQPTVFHHGGICDCTCIGGRYGICKALDGVCKAATRAQDLLKHVASKPGVAMVVVDSKIAGSHPEAAQQEAGAQAARLITENLFDAGYSGKVVISAASLKAIAYVAAAATAFQGSKYQARVYFTIDQSNDVVRTLQALIDKVPSANRVYGTGSTACLWTQYYAGIALASKNVQAGVIGLAYNWTIDRPTTMEKYLKNGTNGILTNQPKALIELLKKNKIALATPQDTIPAATTSTIVQR